MTDEELRRLARAHRVETHYFDWQGREVQVSPDTLRAVLEALAVDSSPAPTGGTGTEPAAEPGHGHAAVPAPLAQKAGRQWGFMTQLYSVRSRQSCGIGDLRDLADLATWSGKELGAGFLLVNPLHAAEPTPRIEPSPYLPSSRRYFSPLYLRIEDLPEYAEYPDREAVTTALRAVVTLDRDEVWAAKSRALELLFQRFVPDQGYRDYRRGEGEALTGFATWCALAELHGNDWRRWPRHEPGGARADRVEFHAWLQWRLDGQLAQAQRSARESGMEIGIIHDLAVGVHPGGADTYLYPDLFAAGISVGAPPDEFNQRGQDWGQPPLHPLRIAADGYRSYREMLAAVLRHAGGLRLDHVMQLSRLWWIPEGADAGEGAYVGYDRAAMLGVLTAEARAVGAVLIGEDLGTVEPSVREDLAAHQVLGTSLLWFERGPEGPRRPEEWRELCLATVGTHDLPPIAGMLHGDHIALRERLGLLTRPVEEEYRYHREELAAWFALLADLGLLRAEDQGEEAAVVRALHGFLARTPARLIGVSLADAAGERRTQNQPGTVEEYPNWRVPLGGPDGRDLGLEDLYTDARLRSLIEPITRAAGS
ncbi:MAG: 4-alpha-glucanotransferase [Streptosporangiaceae bacterium]